MPSGKGKSSGQHGGSRSSLLVASVSSFFLNPFCFRSWPLGSVFLGSRKEKKRKIGRQSEQSDIRGVVGLDK